MNKKSNTNICINGRAYTYALPSVSKLPIIFDALQADNLFALQEDKQQALYTFLLDLVDSDDYNEHPEDVLPLIFRLYTDVTLPILSLERVLGLEEENQAKRKAELEEAIKNETDPQKKLELKGKLIQAKTPRLIALQVKNSKAHLGESTYLIESWLMSVSKSEYCPLGYTELSALTYSDFLEIANKVTLFNNISLALLHEQEKQQALAAKQQQR